MLDDVGISKLHRLYRVNNPAETMWVHMPTPTGLSGEIKLRFDEQKNCQPASGVLPSPFKSVEYRIDKKVEELNKANARREKRKALLALGAASSSSSIASGHASSSSSTSSES